MKQTRIELVRSRAPNTFTTASMNGRIEWHARIKGKNGEIVWVTEMYKRRGSAKKAVLFLLNLPKTVDIREVDETGD